MFSSVEPNHKNLKIRNSLGGLFSVFSIRFAAIRIDLVRIKFESFTLKKEKFSRLSIKIHSIEKQQAAVYKIQQLF